MKTNKKQVKQKIFQGMHKVSEFVSQGKVFLLDKLLSFTCLSLNILKIRLKKEQLKIKLVNSVDKIAELIESKLLIPIFSLLFTLLSQGLNLMGINKSLSDLSILLAQSIIFAILVIDKIFENLVCGVLSFSVNTSFNLLQKIGVIRMKKNEIKIETEGQKALREEAEATYKEYKKILTKYPNSDISEKLAIFVSVAFKRNFNAMLTMRITKRSLQEFERKVLINESENNMIAQELREIFRDKDKFEKLHQWADQFSYNVHNVRLTSRTHEQSIRVFEHILGFILTEIEQEAQIMEVNEEGIKIFNPYQINRDNAKAKIREFLSSQTEYWEKQGKVGYNGEAFNLFKDSGFTYNTYCLAGVERLKNRNIPLPNNTNLAEPEIQEIVIGYKDPCPYPEDPYIDGASFIQFALGKALRVYEGECDPESLAITNNAVMTPIAIMALIHYVADHARDRYVNRTDMIGLNRDLPTIGSYAFGDAAKDGTTRPLGNQIAVTAGEYVDSGKRLAANLWNKSDMSKVDNSTQESQTTWKERADKAFNTILVSTIPAMYVNPIYGFGCLAVATLTKIVGNNLNSDAYYSSLPREIHTREVVHPPLNHRENYTNKENNLGFDIDL